MRSRLPVAAAVLSLVALAGCADGSSAGGPAPTPDGTTLMTRPVLAPGAPDRVSPQMLPYPSGVSGVTLKIKDSPYADGLASEVCGDRFGPDVRMSQYGEAREWTGSGLDIQQFAGIFGYNEAAETVEQVSGVLTCTSYQDRDGEHTAVHRVGLPKPPHVETSLLYCEKLNGAPWCTLLLARRDVVVRFQVRAANETAALDVVRKLSKQSSASFAQG